MSGSETTGRIVVSPTGRFQTWKDVIVQASIDAGFMIAPDGALVRDDPAPARVVIQPATADLPEPGGRQVSLVVDLDQAAQLIGETLDLEPPENLREATRWLASLQAAGADVVYADEADIVIPAFELMLKHPDGAQHIPRPGGSPSAEALNLYAREAQAEISPSLLFYDRRYAGPPGWIDLTGRPRLLAFGPTLWLPPGQWEMRLKLEVEAHAQGRWFQIDWGTQTACDHFDFRPERMGAYEVAMTFDWTESAPAEFRLKVFEGCFEGSIRVLGLKIARAAS